MKQTGSAAKTIPSPAATQPFNWHKIFSFQFLRFAGVLLIITSIFSLLFNIEWLLIYKLILSAVIGVLLLALAEWLRTKKNGISAACSLFSFALLQFTITLGYKYALENGAGEFWLNGDLWTYAKLALTVIMLFTLTRYPSQWQPLAYFAVAYFTPNSLQYVGATLSPIASAVFIVLLSTLSLACATTLKRRSLIVLNAILANVYLNWLLLGNAMNTPYLSLVLLLGVFVAQLLVSVVYCGNNKDTPVDAHIANVIISHVLVLFGTFVLRPVFPLIDTYIGLAFLVLANITLCMYLLGMKMKVNTHFADTLLNTAVIVASIGLFLQVEGPWSAVVFLAYATLVLWYSLYQRNLRTRIYGCIVLLLSIFKLYTQFSDVFDQLWGSVAILVIGLLLVALSYKFEKIKDVMLHGMNK